MIVSEPVRQYVVFEAEKLVGRTVDRHLELDEVERALGDVLGHDLKFRVESLPTARFIPRREMTLKFIPESVAVLTSPDEPSAHDVTNAAQGVIDVQPQGPITGIGAHPEIGISDYSFPGSVNVGLMGTRADANQLIGLPTRFNLDGDGINVVVVDAGLDASVIPLSQWGGGWQPVPYGPAPGTTTGESALHGLMIVQNILAVAPRARIWDVPLIPPPRINDIPVFLGSAQGTFDIIIKSIQQIQQSSGPEQWVFVNAWGIFDRRSEFPYRDYTENRPGSTTTNPFIQRIEDLAQNNFDIIFCSGNCGSVCPDNRCGPNDYGPGRGIWGANAHPKILTVGATRVDCTWIGYSSEGPGPAVKLAKEKPDLCAPSEFLETCGGFPSNTGTSAAAALAAGVVAAFRSKWPQSFVPPTVLNGFLRATAKKTGGASWTPRIGCGILDAGAAATYLPP